MRHIAKQVALCTFGTILEWYDFSLFAALTAIMSVIFFPHTDKYAAMMSTFAVFASGFIMRPIGGIFFGQLGDRIGRKSTLLITILIMTFSTSAIGLIPTGLTISTILVVFLRLLQGFAASGEYPGAIILLGEQTQITKKGFVASFGIFAAPAGIFFGTLICAIASRIIEHTNMIQWGWRIPFLLAAPFGLIGFWIRKALLESEEFKVAEAKKLLVKTPLLILLKKYSGSFLALSCLYILSSSAFYINFIYLGSYSMNLHKLSVNDALYINTLITLIYALSILMFGLLSDYLGKKILMMSACIFIISFTYPLFVFILSGSMYDQILGQAVISALLGMFVGPLAIQSANFFPTQLRYTGVSISLNFATAIFGGTTPIICAWLVRISNDVMMPSYYLITIALLALGVIIFKNRKIKNNLI